MCVCVCVHTCILVYSHNDIDTIIQEKHKWYMYGIFVFKKKILKTK